MPLNTVQKFHGNGNDFIFTDKEVLLSFTSLLGLRNFVVKICNRNFNVGADGVVFCDDDEKALLILNSDGSIAATCGNALRCYGLKLLRENKWTGNSPLSIKRLVPSFVQSTFLEKNEIFATRADDMFATFLEGNLEKRYITVAMGFELQTMLINLPKNEFFTHPVSAVFVALANPHLIFVSQQFASFNPEKQRKFGIWAQNELLNILGSEIPVSNISMIDLQTDAQTLSCSEITQAKPWNLVVYERGAGLTLCCGSGAVASRVALEVLGLVSTSQNKISFNLPGGLVDITNCSIMGQKQRALAGPAEFVFKGILECI